MANGIPVSFDKPTNGIPVSFSGDSGASFTGGGGVVGGASFTGGGAPTAGLSLPEHHDPGFLHLGSALDDIGLGGAAHYVSNTLGNTVHDAAGMLINAPIGFAKLAQGLATEPGPTVEGLGKNFLHDFSPHQLAHHPLYAALDVSNLFDLGAGAALRIGEAGRITARAGAPAAELTSREVAQSLGRVNEYDRAVDPLTGKAVPVGDQVSTVMKRGIPTQQRIIKNPIADEEGKFATQVLGDYARGASWRAAQKLVDKAHEAFPEAHIPVFWKAQAKRIGDAERSAMVYQRNYLRRPAQALIAMSKGLSTPQMVAARVVAEGASIPERIKFHEDQIKGGDLNPRQVTESQKQIKLLNQAKEYIEYKPIEQKTPIDLAHEGQLTLTTEGTPFTKRLFPHIKPEFAQLEEFVNRSRQLAHSRETIFGTKLHDVNAIGRKLNPLRVILGHGTPELSVGIEKEIQRLKNLNDKTLDTHADALAKLETKLAQAKHYEDNPSLIGDEQLGQEALDHLFRVPYQVRPSLRSLITPARYVGGKVAPPSTLTHAFTGGYLKHGGGRTDVAHLMAESYTEAVRYLTLSHARDRIIAMSVKDPQILMRAGVKRDNIVAVNLDVLHNSTQSEALKAWRQQTAGGGAPEDVLHPDEAIALGQQYESLRDQLFKDFNESLVNDPNYAFIDRRLLGGLDQPNPLWGLQAAPGGRTFFKFVDAVNDAVKASVLYLKPSYLFPNWLGNTALSIVHQGFAAPHNLVRAVRMEHSIGKEAVSAMDVLMGGGIESILKSDESKLREISNVGNRLAAGYGKIVDDPARRAAFYEEAIRAGFTTPEHMKALLLDDKFAKDAQTIAQRAAKEIIDYEDLSPFEQSVVRRVIFFYPFVKGSARYALHFAQNHPLATLAGTQLAKSGEEWQKEILGQVPAYAEGLIPFGHKQNNGHPYVINPSSASILQEPGELVEAVANLFSGHPNRDLNLWKNLAPYDAFVFSLASGQPVSGPNNPHQNIAENALGQLYGGNPIALAVHNILHPNAENRVYPGATGKWNGIPIQTLIALSKLAALGSGTPQPYNPVAGQYSAYTETHGR